MKLTFPPKKLQIIYALRGGSFGIMLALALYMMNYLSLSGSVPFISDSFVWLLLLGVISFVWLISYVALGAVLPFVVTINQINEPSLWGIIIPPLVCYVVVFWLIGSIFWVVQSKTNNVVFN